MIFAPPHRRAAFTLIEIVISASLMALILVSAYACLQAGFAAQKTVEPRIEVIQNARVALALMAADLRAACPLSRNQNLLGTTRPLGDIEAGNLDFGTHNYTPRRPGEGDFCQESLYLGPDRETGQIALWRRRNPMIALNPLEGGSKEKIATGVAGLKFEYFDGVAWQNSYGDADDTGASKSSRDQAAADASATFTSGLPEAIRITLLMDSEPKKKTAETTATDEKPAPPFVFQTIVRLNLADTTPPAVADNSPDGSGSTGNNGGAP